MISYLEDTHFFAMNNINAIKEKEFLLKNTQNTLHNNKLKLYHSSNSNNYNDISIELDEEREEKDEQFRKSFHEVFLIKDNFEENDIKNSYDENIIEDNNFNNEYNGKNKEYENIFYLINKDGQGRSLGRLRRDIIPLYEIKKDKFDKNNIL